MATAARRGGGSAVVVRRSSGSTALAKAKKRVSAVYASRSREKRDSKIELAMIMGAMGFGLVRRFGIDLPSIKGVPDALSYGGGLYLLGRSMSGNAGLAMRMASLGVMAPGFYSLTAGKLTLSVSGADDDAGAFDDFEQADFGAD